MATVYHRDDPGAPAYAWFSTDINAAAHFSSLKNILKGCLVTGYAGKPAAGWELIAEGTYYLVLRNGSHSGYVCLTWTANRYMTVYVAETFLGMSGNVMQGDGLKTGTGADASAPQRLDIGYLAYSSAISGWYVVADEKTCVFRGTGYGSGSNLELSGSIGNTTIPLYLGEDIAGNFIAMGGQNTTGGSVLDRFDAVGMTSLKDPSTGLLVGAGSLSVSSPGLSFPASSAAVLVQGEVSLSPAPWFGPGGYWSRLRGVALAPTVLALHPSAAARSLGAAGPLMSRNIYIPLDMSDEWIYLIGPKHSASATHLVTNNPEFW